MYNYRPVYDNELTHYGILGQKWGVRRFQNPDGTLTAAGKSRYAITNSYEMNRYKAEQNAMAKSNIALNKAAMKYDKAVYKAGSNAALDKATRKYNKAVKKAEDRIKNVQNKTDKYYSLSDSEKKRVRGLSVASKILAAAGGVAASTFLGAFGASVAVGGALGGVSGAITSGVFATESVLRTIGSVSAATALSTSGASIIDTGVRERKLKT